MPSNKKLLQAAAGNAGESLYVEDVFSTYLYTGNGTGQTITNDIDLSGEGGLVWMKDRTTGNVSVGWNTLVDTERGGANQIWSNSTNGQVNLPSRALTFNSNGFSVSADIYHTNRSGDDFASFTFRKAEKFFDVVTYTGNGTAGRTVSHNLGSVPAVIVVKSTTNGAYNWMVYHQSLGNTNYLRLNETTQTLATAGAWNNTTPTDSEFTLGGASVTNGNGESFVAYLFASDAGGFGDDGSESIIKCGSYTGNGGSQEINLGFEPQWLMIKKSSATGSWQMIDVMRGMPVDAGSTKYLLADSSIAEYGGGAEYQAQPTATGFKLGLSNDVNQSGVGFIYIAIRRPMKTPESGTEVFAVGTNQEVPSATSGFYSGFPVDMAIKRIITASQPNYLFDRLRGGQALVTNTTAAETGFGAAEFDHQQGWYYDSDSANTNDYSWMFKRATGFFDVVAYTGNPSVAENHNLGVPPELIITKEYAHTWDWYSWGSVLGANKFVTLNSNAAATNYTFNSTVTATTFMAGIASSGQPTIAYLFATLAGVSKVGSYTGTGSNVDVDCGFSAGARFILIKRTDSASNWYLWDSARGITAGNDPYIQLNNTNAQNSGQDAIDPLASGFTVTAAADVNQSGGTYIFLAIA